LYDVLLAQRARLSRRAFADFYTRAMTLAALDPVLPHSSLPTEATMDSALYSVLLEWCPRTKANESDWKQRSDGVAKMKDRLLSELTAAYAQPHRHYHTKTHIDYCLYEVGNVWNYAVHLNELRWAILFHDAVYDPKKQDNEARSADWACKVMAELERPEDEQARVRALIMATAHSVEPSTPDEALLLDIDLSILGAEDTVFDQYDQAILQEYEWVPMDRYREARARVLEAFVKRDTLYQTAHYRQRLEASARQNLQRALLKLQTQN
jgi:predicted metal-dependent HD superfamily phosphohydrolase